MSTSTFSESDYGPLSHLSVMPQLHPRTQRPINKPEWLKIGLGQGDKFYSLKTELRSKKLHTVCESAKCPNIGECWSTSTATFMILGDVCTRACRFCHIKTGNPAGVINPHEPALVAASIAEMHLDYAVITMVDRDDMPDGGAFHVAQTILEIQKVSPKTRIEILSGDFAGSAMGLQQVIQAGRGLDVLAHNVETVERLSPRVRDARAQYRQSLNVLKNAFEIGSKHNMLTKSAIMLGLGETGQEIYQTLKDLRQVKVDIVTIGQYLQPTHKHLKVKRFVHPQEFGFWEKVAKGLGFLAVASGPLVRSSYKASHLFSERS